MYSFHKLVHSDIPEATACILNTFTTDEPMVTAQQISEAEFRTFIEPLVNKAADDGLSVVAKANEKVIGCIISEDAASEPPEGLEQVTEKMNPILDLLEQLSESYYANGNELVPGHFYHMFIGSVYPAYSGEKITENMLKKAEDMARELGYKASVVEATGSVSQYIFEHRTAYQEKARLRYADFRYQNQAVFQTIPVDYCRLYEKKL